MDRPAVISFLHGGLSPPCKTRGDVRLSMDGPHPPEVVRERVSRVAGNRLSCALIFEREFTREEVARFRALSGCSTPLPKEFELEGRVLRYECLDADEAEWRLAAQIYLVKSFRAAPPRRQTTSDIRRRMGLAPIPR